MLTIADAIRADNGLPRISARYAGIYLMMDSEVRLMVCAMGNATVSLLGAGMPQDINEAHRVVTEKSRRLASGAIMVKFPRPIKCGLDMQHRAGVCGYHLDTLFTLVTHLNDLHRMSFEQIAEALDDLGYGGLDAHAMLRPDPTPPHP